MDKNLLVIFYTDPSREAKPLLKSAIGTEKTQAVCEYLVETVRTVADGLPFDKAVFYDGPVTTEDRWDDSQYVKQPQSGQDRGERMQNAFTWAFSAGYKNVCVIVTDCHGLTSEIITRALEFLDEGGDAIIGPSKDGGYYLLGLNRVYPELFVEKSWDSYTLLDDTLQDFERLELQYGKLPVLVRINEKRDLPARLRF
nr:MAG: glycosyltransferase [Bacteroidota bacterium]